MKRPSSHAHHVRFATTRWSRLVEPAAGPARAACLEALAADYWHPLYAYLRQRGFARTDAEDLTQAFFAFLLEGDRVQQASPERGRFRNFLLAALRNFLANEWRGRQALKRGGGCEFSSWDFAQAEQKFAADTSSSASPELRYEREWALAIMHHALDRVRGVYERAGKLRLFDELKGYLAGEDEASLAQIAARLQLSPTATRAALHRLRKRCRDAIRGEVARTLASTADLDAEIAMLLGGWQG